MGVQYYSTTAAATVERGLITVRGLEILSSLLYGWHLMHCAALTERQAKTADCFCDRMRDLSTV